MADRSLLQQLHAARSSLSNARKENERVMSLGLGQLTAGVGGAACAVTRKYIGKIVPGEAMDEAAPWIVGLILDGVALSTGSDEWNYFAAGFGGHLTGTAVEKILP